MQPAGADAQGGATQSAEGSATNPSTPGHGTQSHSVPSTPAADGFSTLPTPSGPGPGTRTTELPSQGDFDRMADSGVPIYDHEDWWGATQYGHPVDVHVLSLPSVLPRAQPKSSVIQICWYAPLKEFNMSVRTCRCARLGSQRWCTM